jgi:hypothetical protein
LRGPFLFFNYFFYFNPSRNSKTFSLTMRLEA